MAGERFATVEEYVAALEPGVREAVAEVIRIIGEAVPEAEAVISYQVPAFKHHGGWLWYVAGFTKHFSLSHPPPLTELDAFAGELAGHKSSRSAIQFPLKDGVPADLIRRMALYRAEQLQRPS